MSECYVTKTLSINNAQRLAAWRCGGISIPVARCWWWIELLMMNVQRNHVRIASHETEVE